MRNQDIQRHIYEVREADALKNFICARYPFLEPTPLILSFVLYLAHYLLSISLHHFLVDIFLYLAVYLSLSSKPFYIHVYILYTYCRACVFLSPRVRTPQSLVRPCLAGIQTAICAQLL